MTSQISSGAAPLVELNLSLAVPVGSTTVSVALDPPTMVEPPQPSKYFAVQYISIFARVPVGQSVHCSVNGGYGGHWLSLFHQGTFEGYDVYVCSQLCAFTIVPTSAAQGRIFSAVRSASDLAGIVDLHLVGAFL